MYFSLASQQLEQRPPFLRLRLPDADTGSMIHTSRCRMPWSLLLSAWKWLVMRLTTRQDTPVK